MTILSKHTIFNHTVFAVFLVAAVLLVVYERVVMADPAVKAAEWSEVTGVNMQITENSGTPWKYWHQPHCKPTIALVEDEGSRTEREVCYIGLGRGQLATYTMTESGGPVLYAVRYDGDEVFHKISDMMPPTMPLPPTFSLLADDTLVGGLAFLPMLSLVNFQTKLTPVITESAPGINYLTYKVGESVTPENFFYFGEGISFPAFYVAVSKNERYAVVQPFAGQLVRIDLHTREVKLVVTNLDNIGPLTLAISNDGNTISVTGNWTQNHRIYTGLSDCGSVEISYLDRKSSCYFVDFSGMVSWLVADPAKGYVYNSEFSEDGKTFTTHIWNEEQQTVRKLTFTPDPKHHRLDYLALGDSYTSGEGDIGRRADGKKYYLPGTDTGDDNCHISSRSYPFLLRNDWSITSDKMKSVACSGAQVLPDMWGDSNNYYGQGGRLVGKSQREKSQEDALTNFTPGYTQQIEFVKKYQPKLMTLTGGGNDAGFARILRYCVTPAFENFVPIINSDCQQAIKGSDLEKDLYDTIDTQYGFTKKLVQRIQTASPATKIVVIGYPSFIRSTVTIQCGFNAGALSDAEATMINTMVDYMNSMLQRAAYDMGVGYVNITDVLTGGRICEHDKYVTGLHDQYLGGGAKEEDLFHPNAKGHQLMAQRIKQAEINALDTTNIPSSGTYIPPESRPESEQPMKTVKTNMVQNSVVMKTWDFFTVRVIPGTLRAASWLINLVYSTPTNLGQFTASADGSAEITVPLDNIEIGRHVLVIEGTDPQGEPIRLFQFIEVRASETDADGDSIPDDQDPCQYITVWYDETTGENVCEMHPTFALGGHGAKGGLTSTNKTTSYDNSQNFALAGNFSVISEPTEHATITNRPITKNGHSASINIISIIMIALLCVVGVTYAYKKIKQN